MKVSTLRDLIAAMGGELHITATDGRGWRTPPSMAD